MLLFVGRLNWSFNWSVWSTNLLILSWCFRLLVSSPSFLCWYFNRSEWATHLLILSWCFCLLVSSPNFLYWYFNWSEWATHLLILSWCFCLLKGSPSFLYWSFSWSEWSTNFVAESLMLTFKVLLHWNTTPQALYMIFHPVTLYWHWADQFWFLAPLSLILSAQQKSG